MKASSVAKASPNALNFIQLSDVKDGVYDANTLQSIINGILGVSINSNSTAKVTYEIDPVPAPAGKEQA